MIIGRVVHTKFVCAFICTPSTFSHHKQKERNWFIEQLQKFAKIHRIRISFLSGDVHCAAVGVFKTLKAAKTAHLSPSEDHRYMINVVTSQLLPLLNAIYIHLAFPFQVPSLIHPRMPPLSLSTLNILMDFRPNGVISLVSSLASKNHKTMHHSDTDESMVSLARLSLYGGQKNSTVRQIPIFKTETNGKPRKQKFIMGRRNWCQVDWDDGAWVFEICVEKEKGIGQTVGYSVRSPPPRWTATP